MYYYVCHDQAVSNHRLSWMIILGRHSVYEVMNKDIQTQHWDRNQSISLAYDVSHCQGQ